MGEKKIIAEDLGDVYGLVVYYEGSGNPAERHEIIGIRYHAGFHHRYIGDLDKMHSVEKYIDNAAHDE